MWIIAFVFIIIAFAIGYFIAWNSQEKKRITIKNTSDKHLALFRLMDDWTNVKIKGKKVEDFFIRREYKNIAIYGMSYVGKTLLHELEESEINVAYGIEKNIDNVYVPIPLIKPSDELPLVDCIVVTPITYFDDIAEMLEKKVDCPIICMEDILYEL